MVLGDRAENSRDELVVYRFSGRVGCSSLLHDFIIFAGGVEIGGRVLLLQLSTVVPESRTFQATRVAVARSSTIRGLDDVSYPELAWELR